MGVDDGRGSRPSGGSLSGRIDIFSPVFQGALILAILPPLMGVLRATGLDEGIWLAAAGAPLLFILFNPFLGLRSLDYFRYTILSVAVFIALLFASVILAGGMSGISLEEYGPGAMVFLAPVIYYPISIGAALIARIAVNRKRRGPPDLSVP